MKFIHIAELESQLPEILDTINPNDPPDWTISLRWACEPVARQIIEDWYEPVKTEWDVEHIPAATIERMVDALVELYEGAS